MNEPSFGEMMKNKVMTGQQLRCMYQIKWKKYIILNVIFLTIFIYLTNYRLYILVQIKHNKEEILVIYIYKK